MTFTVKNENNLVIDSLLYIFLVQKRLVQKSQYIFRFNIYH